MTLPPPLVLRCHHCHRPSPPFTPTEDSPRPRGWRVWIFDSMDGPMGLEFCPQCLRGEEPNPELPITAHSAPRYRKGEGGFSDEDAQRLREGWGKAVVGKRERKSVKRTRGLSYRECPECFRIEKINKHGRCNDCSRARWLLSENIE